LAAKSKLLYDLVKRDGKISQQDQNSQLETHSEKRAGVRQDEKG